MLVAALSINGGDNCGTGGVESAVWLSVASRTQRNEGQFGIVSAAAAEMLVMESRLDIAPDNWQCQSSRRSGLQPQCVSRFAYVGYQRFRILIGDPEQSRCMYRKEDKELCNHFKTEQLTSTSSGSRLVSPRLLLKENRMPIGRMPRI